MVHIVRKLLTGILIFIYFIYELLISIYFMDDDDQLEEGSSSCQTTNRQMGWEAEGVQNISYTRQLPPQSEGFYHPLSLVANSNMQIGYVNYFENHNFIYLYSLQYYFIIYFLNSYSYNHMGQDESDLGAPSQEIHGFIPGWML